MLEAAIWTGESRTAILVLIRRRLAGALAAAMANRNKAVHGSDEDVSSSLSIRTFNPIRQTTMMTGMMMTISTKLTESMYVSIGRTCN